MNTKELLRRIEKLQELFRENHQWAYNGNLIIYAEAADEFVHWIESLTEEANKESLCVVCSKPFVPTPTSDPYACSSCAGFEIGGLLLAIGDKNG